VTNYYNKLKFSNKVLVNLKTNKAFKGVLTEEKGKVIVLNDVELIEPNTESVKMAGSVLIEKENIDFIQIIGG
jgi:small nuclear ribonucleoprotein (snRNP)-like protein